MREIGRSLGFLLQESLLDLHALVVAALRLLLPMAMRAGRQSLTWYALVMAALLYFGIAPVAQRWNDRDTGRAFVVIVLLYPFGELFGRKASNDITAISIKRHTAWLEEMDESVHRLNALRAINDRELREFRGDYSMSELQMKTLESQERITEIMAAAKFAALPASETQQQADTDAPLLDLNALTNTVMLIMG